MVAGASGYIGGRLVPRLLERGRPVRCLARSESKLRAKPWASDPNVEIIQGGVEDADALAEAMRGCEAAYYLVHSMNSAGGAYRQRDLELAEAFGTGARDCGVERILYLGGLGETGSGLSEHLESRREVERVLGHAGVPVTVLRAAMIIGSGSASFEILRYLVERLPVMVTPRWVRTESQPIAVRDVLHYLVTALETPETTGRAIDIGGPDIWSYQHLMRELADVLQLPRRVIVPVPVLTPKLSSLWIHLVTPLPSTIARPLAEGLRNRVVCRNDAADELMPHECLGMREAMMAAVTQTRTDMVETAWSDAGAMAGDPDWAGGTVFVDRRTAEAKASPDAVWKAICALGGEHGYFAANGLWKLRGWMDRLVGGPGLVRRRRSAAALRVGDALDFWRVSTLQRPSTLELTAEMKLPGVATLTFDIEQADESAESSRIVMTARFRPRGLTGLVYWFAVLPLHGIVFRGLLRGLVRTAEAGVVSDGPTTSAPHLSS